MGIRLLFLSHPGTNSRDILFDMADGYREAGAEILTFELGPLWAGTDPSTGRLREADVRLYAGAVEAFARANQIDAAVSMWANGAFSLGTWEGKSFFEYVGLPVVMQWLDAPHWANDGDALEAPASVLNGPHSIHVINNAATAQEMNQILGFSNVLCLSNAASPARFRPYPVARKDFDIVFAVGADSTQPTELMLAELDKDEPDIAAIRAEAAQNLRPQLCESLRGLWGDVAGLDEFVDAMLRERLANRHEPVLQQIARVANAHRSLAPRILALLQDRRRYVDFTMALRGGIESWERAFTFVYLSRYFRCAAFGLSRPFEGWPGQWEWLGTLPHEDQAKAYSRGSFGLNVMRWQDDAGLNLKPFEITLSGACLLQSYRVGFEAHFDAGQAVAFHTPQECRRKVMELLAEPSRVEAIALAGRARSFSQHCWRHRAAEVLKLLQRVAPPRWGRSAVSRTDQGGREDASLVFVIGMWRGGTTLLRKILDSHSQIYAPAETWFLLPLLALWDGESSDGSQHLRQAAAAVRGHIRREQFLDCVRAFANRFYRSIRPPQARYVVDKTPLYLRIADVLPVLFPEARFLVLARDPRGTVWSRHTWKHIQSRSPEDHFEAVAQEMGMLRRFLEQYAGRSLHVSYERICENAAAVAGELCGFLDLPVEAGMIRYGDHPHHEGYGDEKTLQHRGPHTDAMRRWEQEGGISLPQQVRLATLCGRENLVAFGYDELAAMIEADAPVPAHAG
jgi:hypothetical protein